LLSIAIYYIWLYQTLHIPPILRPEQTVLLWSTNDSIESSVELFLVFLPHIISKRGKCNFNVSEFFLLIASNQRLLQHIHYTICCHDVVTTYQQFTTVEIIDSNNHQNFITGDWKLTGKVKFVILPFLVLV